MMQGQKNIKLLRY